MISAIIHLVSTLVGSIFHLVGGILAFVFALPLWLIAAQNLIGLIIVACIAGAVIRKAIRK